MVSQICTGDVDFLRICVYANTSGIDNSVQYNQHICYCICVKFHENMSIGFRVMKRKRMLKALTDSDGRTLKISEPRHFLVAGHKNLFVIN